VRVQVDPKISMPRVQGIFRAVVVLPDIALAWPAERVHAVLTHELIHVKRWDCLTSFIAECAAAVHWFNPLAWFALRELRREREISCDDAVLVHGIDGCDYADHLLAVVAGTPPSAPAGAIAVGEASHLETRIRSILNPRIPKGGTTLKSKSVVAALALLAAAALSAWQAAAQSGTAALSGSVVDASSARVADAVVVVRNIDAGTREITTSDEAGEWRFASLPAGTYTVEVAKPGFQLYKEEKLVLTAGSAQNLQVVLSLGRIRETIDVSAERTQPQTATSGRTPQRIRMGGSVQAAKLLKSVRPEYPPHLKAAGIEGTVLLECVIGRDGKVVNLRALNSLVHSDLVEAAMNAIRQWEYAPTHLNGEPVEIITDVTVNFRLK
jgi:TonB family protein